MRVSMLKPGPGSTAARDAHTSLTISPGGCPPDGSMCSESGNSCRSSLRGSPVSAATSLRRRIPASATANALSCAAKESRLRKTHSGNFCSHRFVLSVVVICTRIQSLVNSGCGAT